MRFECASERVRSYECVCVWMEEGKTEMDLKNVLAYCINVIEHCIEHIYTCTCM